MAEDVKKNDEAKVYGPTEIGIVNLFEEEEEDEANTVLNEIDRWLEIEDTKEGSFFVEIDVAVNMRVDRLNRYIKNKYEEKGWKQVRVSTGGTNETVRTIYFDFPDSSPPSGSTMGS